MPLTLWNGVFLCFLLVILSTVICSSSSAHVNFPTISSNKIIRAAEGSTLTLPFNLDISNSPRSSNQTVYVYVSTPRRQDFCAVRLTPEGCTSNSNNKCLCVDDTSAEKGAVLTKTVTRADRGLWMWRTGDGSVRTEIRLDVQESVSTVAWSSEKDSRREDGVTTAVANNELVHQPAVQDVNTTCSAQPAKEGQLSAIDLYFHGIDFSADQFYIFLEKDDKDILQCGDLVTKAAQNCTIVHDSFELAGTADRNMTVIIPVATYDLRGIYILQTQVNGTFVSPTSCEFVVYQGGSSSPLPTTEKQICPAIVPIVVPTVLPIVVVCVVIIIAVVVVRRNKRGPYHPARNDENL